MHKKTLASTIIALGLAGTAFAASGATYPSTTAPSTTAPGTSSTSSPDSMNSSAGMNSQEFANLDADGDGIVSKREAGKNKDVKKQWSKLDTNKDGKLDAMEFSQFELDASGDSMKR